MYLQYFWENIQCTNPSIDIRTLTEEHHCDTLQHTLPHTLNTHCNTHCNTHPSIDISTLIEECNIPSKRAYMYVPPDPIHHAENSEGPAPLGCPLGLWELVLNWHKILPTDQNDHVEMRDSTMLKNTNSTELRCRLMQTYLYRVVRQDGLTYDTCLMCHVSCLYVSCHMCVTPSCLTHETCLTHDT